MLQISKVIPSQLQGSRFPSTLLLLLWLAECRASELGYLLEGEVGLPYPTPGKQQVYKAEFPLCLYPTTCLSCGRLLQGEPRQRFCNGTCRSDWSTMKEQFVCISQLAATGQSVLDAYGTVLNAYSLFIRNPNYLSYQSRNPEIQARREALLNQGLITLYKDIEGKPVDLQGNSLPSAELITDIEDILT
ncbi:hypothetical protein [Vampirovibrio sp.]|uniref:hypothetical protein n=1 Tax=Vampirovibrio sp. TaxID=2717857 RepID=UPI0035939780